MMSLHCLAPRTQRQLRSALVLVLLWGSAFAQGNDDPFGISLRFVPTAAIATNDPRGFAPTARGGLAVQMTELEAYLRKVGAFDPSLAPRQLGLARLLAESGDREAALKYYRAALHNLRINGGLNDLEQIPVLEELMALLQSPADIPLLRSYSDELFRLEGQGAQPFNEKILHGLVAWLDRETELLLSPEADSRWLLDTYERAENWRETICADVAWQDPWCSALTERVIVLLYVIDYWIEPVVVTETRYSAFEREPRALGDWGQSPTDQKLITLDRRVASLGNAAIEQALAIDESLLMIQLAADWAWYHNQRGLAAERWALLIDRGVVLNTPAPVPALLGELRNPLLAETRAEVHVSANITASGRVRDCAATLPSETEGISPSYVCRQLRTTRFRPAVDNDGNRLTASYEAQLLLLKN